MQAGRRRTTGSRSTSVPASPRSGRSSGCCWSSSGVIDATVDSRAQQRLAVVSSYLAGLLGWCLGEVDDAATRAERAADLYEQVGDSARARAARCDLAWFEGLARRYAAQEVLTRQVLAAAEAADDHETTLVALSSLFAAAAVRGDFDDAWSASRRLVETAKSCENPSRVAFGLAIRGAKSRVGR